VVALEMSKVVPVLLAVHSGEIDSLRTAFKKEEIFNLAELTKGKSLPELEIIVKRQFPEKNINDHYGVYLLSEDLARGIDFPSTYQIEEAGGIFLLLCSVFSSTVIQQLKGRVARLKNKGQWQYCVCTKRKESAPNYLEVQKEILDAEETRLREELRTCLQKSMLKSEEQKDIPLEENLSAAIFKKESPPGIRTQPAVESMMGVLQDNSSPPSDSQGSSHIPSQEESEMALAPKIGDLDY